MPIGVKGNEEGIYNESRWWEKWHRIFKSIRIWPYLLY